MKILLALDESKFSEAALRTFITQMRCDDTQVRVVHAVEPMEIIFPEGKWEMGTRRDLEEVRKAKLQNAHNLLTAAAESLRSAGFAKVESAVLEGDARVALLDAAAQWPADLIVIGSHGRKGLNRFLLGSVSEFVTRHAPCSVQVVRSTVTA
jgi:nucleotide-binding universal stress UspA family protein